jgi:hypothetical protein
MTLLKWSHTGQSQTASELIAWNGAKLVKGFIRHSRLGVRRSSEA